MIHDDQSDSRAGTEQPPWRRPVAFALSGGGAFGPVQIGMLEALAARGISPDLVVGTSVGALNGAMVAARGGGVDGLAAAAATLRRLWLGIDRRAVFGRRRGIPGNLLRHRSIADPEALGTLIDRELPARRIEEMALPFAAVATDAITGQPALLTTGELRTALLASSAVPGVLPPVTIGDRVYIDGGVSANVPIRQALWLGAATVVALDTTPRLLATQVPTGMLGGAIHAIGLMVRNQRADAIDDVGADRRVIVLPSAVPPDIGTFAFHRTATLVDDSYTLARDALDRVWGDRRHEGATAQQRRAPGADEDHDRPAGRTSP